MESTVNERLFQFIKREVGSVRELAAALNISEVTLGNKIRGDRKLDMELLIAILRMYPQLSADWLLLESGPMLRSEINRTSTGVKDAGNLQQTIDILERELKEEKDRSNKYWDTIQKLIK